MELTRLNQILTNMFMAFGPIFIVVLTGCDSGARYIDCIDGCSNAPIGAPGPQGDVGPTGPVGPQGPEGEPGLNGVSCTLTDIPGGVLLGCTDGSSAQVMDGSDAALETILLCPALTGGNFQQYLLRIAGSLYTVSIHGQSIGITKIGPGSYVSSDGRNCVFVVDANLNVGY